MNWNKSTPESEMKDDIKAMADKGGGVLFLSEKKRHEGEIVSQRFSLMIKKGNKG
jgi:hypothetical protein